MSDSARLEVMLLRPGARLPERQSPLATGFDLHACLEGAEIEVAPTPTLVPTGIAIAAPAGYDVQVRPRSGLSARGVIVVLGTLDADYRARSSSRCTGCPTRRRTRSTTAIASRSSS